MNKIFFNLPELKYKFDALEPIIDKKTMEIHYKNHHSGYVNNLNQALLKIENNKENIIIDNDIEYFLKNLHKIDNQNINLKKIIKDNGGGHFNHTLFWNVIDPNYDKLNYKNLEIIKKVIYNFDSIENLKLKIIEFGIKRFGSGWVWLVLNNKNNLEIISTPNQDNPLMYNYNINNKIYPLMGIDVWEHAYYLKYQSQRAEYLKNIFNIINWNFVNTNYLKYFN